MTEPSNELRYRRATVEGQEVGVTSFRIGARFACRVDNVDPGSVIGRGNGATRDEAEQAALDKASLSLGLTQATQALRRSVGHLTTLPAPPSKPKT